MPFQIVRDDIIRMPVDAIVCPTDSRLSGSGGLDASVHIAAGPKMAEECRKLGGCPVGEARIVPGFWLSAKHVIFTVGPKWSGNPDDAGLLYSCVRSALALAAEHSLESVAVPLIATGTFGFPKDAAMEAERNAITDFLGAPDAPDITVYLVLYGSESYALGSRFFPRIQAYIDDHYLSPGELVPGGRGSRRALLRPGGSPRFSGGRTGRRRRSLRRDVQFLPQASEA